MIIVKIGIFLFINSCLLLFLCLFSSLGNKKSTEFNELFGPLSLAGIILSIFLMSFWVFT
jgi:hypothetical protein